jgi:hypothetical protein
MLRVATTAGTQPTGGNEKQVEMSMSLPTYKVQTLCDQSRADWRRHWLTACFAAGAGSHESSLQGAVFRRFLKFCSPYVLHCTCRTCLKSTLHKHCCCIVVRCSSHRQQRAAADQDHIAEHGAAHHSPHSNGNHSGPATNSSRSSASDIILFQRLSLSPLWIFHSFSRSMVRKRWAALCLHDAAAYVCAGLPQVTALIFLWQKTTT